ncbi:unnamed protein product [Clonostachys rhizophaga]|uniref:MIF4G domain-containing protein n=1 Tax=Clonostachys rhizophaga TaxID=160324 RepID=A0A9N9VAX5_9HYPO|nr:unnamed protein product [Clonostachys rhizophaga]
MTSSANQQNSVSATNNTATAVPSYASAAGVLKKSASQSPAVITGSQPPVVVGSSASPAQNAKPASTSSLNGKSAVTPAIPAVARGSSASNGNHTRQSSVTMAANGPNSYISNGGPVGGAKSGIQFGFDSPAMAHSTPQTGSSAPIPIPGGNARVPSPAHSPSPIPQPSASGGRPPSGLQQPASQMTFGSLSSDGERHMRQGSVPPNPVTLGGQQPGAHFRRESNHSVQSDHAGRGNFTPQAGRGRGFNPHSSSYNNQMGYPPNNQFRNGQGRGMAPSFQPSPRNMYPNSPQPNRSPLLVPSMPGTPNMPPANMQPNMSMQTPPQYHYAPPMPPQHQQVQLPFYSLSIKAQPFKPFKKVKSHRESDRLHHQPGRRSDSVRELCNNDSNQPNRRSNRRGDHSSTEHDLDSTLAVSDDARRKPLQQTSPPNAINSTASASLDMSPGNYEHLLLTMKRQNFGFPPQQLDQYGRPYGYNMPYMPPPQANSPGYNQTFVPPPYQQPVHSMSRTPSQPERPSSANQQAPAVAMGSSNKSTTPAQTNSAFVKPKKGAAIPIKSLSGEVLDTTSFKVPLSPALGIQHTKTPPVAASTPTPPPKSSTPGHSRTDSAAAPKTAKQIQDELKEKIKQATLASKNKEEKPAAPASPAPEPTPEAPKKEAEAPAKPTPAPAAADVPKKEEPVQEKEPEKPSAPAQETPEEEMERIIREMEEADAKREAEEEAHRVKREAEKAAEKQKAEENRKANAADEDKKLRDQEREMERLEEEKEKKRQEAEKSGKAFSVADALAGKAAPKEAEGSKVDAVTDKLASMKLAGEKGDAKPTTAEKRGAKPAALNLAPLITKPVEPPQPSAALQSLKSARFLQIMDQEIYPAGIRSPNPALNAAVAKKGKTFKYDANFLMQFQKVFTEQPSLEFHQQVKSLIGDNDGSRSASGRGAQTPGSGRQSSRGGGGGFNMGAFNAPMRPAGSTSAERFQQASVGRGSITPMNSFQRPGGAFPMSSGMGSRTPSQGSGMGPSSGSRTGSRANRNSRRPQDQSAKDAKTMPLTAGQEVKPIAVTSTGWKPTSIGRGAAGGGAASSSTHLDPEMVQRKVKAALNKMTPDNFEKISDQILVIASQSKDETDGRTLRQVIQLTFEKATDEAHWASMYAKFCKKMLETMNPEIHDERIKDKNGNVVSGGNLFRKYLLNRCQEEFERGWQVNLPEPKESEENKKPGEAVMLSDEYYTAAAAKRRGLGLVQFIGELYKLGMLTERIMLECVHKLVDHKGVPDEAEIESLSKLLRTIGANLDRSEKGRPMMDVYFDRIQQMVDSPDLASRMKFMLMDVLDLRKSNWHSKETNKGPKTLEEVRAEAEAAQAAKAQENARSNQRGGGGRPAMGRGDARNFSTGNFQQNSNQVIGDDLRRLKGSANRSSSGNVTLGPTSMFSSRSNSGRRMGPGGALGRPGEDSGASSRTGTPPVRENSSSNAFSLLANMDNDHPASPPSTAVSPAISKAVPAGDKKDGE